MEKIKNIIGKIKNINKKYLIITGGVVGLVAIIAVMFVLFSNNQEKKLNESLKSLGVDFYENFYYEQIGTTKEEKEAFLKKFSNIGIKVNLDNLSRFNTEENKEIIKSFVNKKTDKDCDRVKSRVIIYPKNPYEKDSYKIETELFCGFKDEKQA